jgi:hypothetical protein
MRSGGRPQEIIEATRAAYASCASYRDRGNVHTDFFDPAGEITMSEDRPFSTVFRRPDRFRYEFRGETGGRPHRYIVWREGAAVRTRWDLSGQDDTPDSLALGLAGATGVSGGSAHTVPSLLLPGEFEGDALRKFVDLQRVGETSIDGALCHHLTAGTVPIPAAAREQMNDTIQRVTGMDSAAVPIAEHGATQLWIAIDTCLLRRLERQVNFGRFATTSVTDYSAGMNVSLADDEFGFDGGGPVLLN